MIPPFARRAESKVAPFGNKLLYRGENRNYVSRRGSQVASRLAVLAVFAIYIVSLTYVAFWDLRRAWLFIYGSQGSRGYLYDFKLFYGGVRDYFTAGSLYHVAAALPFERILDRPNNNSPVGSVLIAPFAMLPLPLAAAIWQGVSLVLLLIAIALIWRVYPRPQSRWQRAGLLVLLLASMPMSDALLLGPWSMLLTCADIAVWWMARTGRERIAGCILGIAVVIRWQAAWPLFAFIVLRRWRIVGWSMLASAIAIAASLPIFGIGMYGAFLHLIVFNIGGSGSTAWDGSWRGEIDRLFAELARYGIHLPISPVLPWIVISLTLVLLTRHYLMRLPFDEAYSLCLVAGLLITPLSWMHYHLTLLLPLAVIAKSRLWPVILVAAFWLYAVAIALRVYMHPVVFGSALTGSLLLLYAVLSRLPDMSSEDPSRPIFAWRPTHFR